MRFQYQFQSLCGAIYSGGTVVFSPDGRSLFSPVGNRVTVFDLTLHRTRTLPASTPNNIHCLALSPDGVLLFAVDVDGRSFCMHLHQRQVLFEFALGSACQAVRFSPNQRLIAFALGSQIHIYHCPPVFAAHRAMNRHLVFASHHDTIRCLEWSPNSLYLLSGGDDHTARIHSLVSSTPTSLLPQDEQEEEEHRSSFVPLTLAGHRGAVMGAFWASKSSLDASSRVYTISSDGQLLNWRWVPTQEAGVSNESASTSSSLTASHSHIARPARTSLTLFGIKGYFKLSSKHFFNANTNGVSVSSVALHRTPHSMDLLVVAFTSGVFSLYELPTFTLIHSLSVTASALSSICISRDGAWLALASASAGSLCVWEWQSESYILKQQGHTALITCLAYSPDGQFLVTGGDDGRVKLWNSHTGFCFKTFTHHTAPVTSVAFSEVGAVVLSCSLDGTARAYDLARYRLFRTLTPPQPVQYSHLSLDPSGELAVAVSSDPFELHVYSLQTGKLIETLQGHTAPISGIAFAPALALFFTSSWDKTVRVWDIFNGRGCVDTFSHEHEVLALAVNPNGESLAAALLNGDLALWSITEAQVLGVIEARRDIQHGRSRDQARSALNSVHATFVSTLCYSADGSSLLCGGNSRYVCIYDVASRLLLRKFVTATNESLDGIKDKLNSRYVNDSAPLDEDDRAALPGVRRGDRSQRKAVQSIKIRDVRFAPSGSQFSCATPEGLMIFSLDQELSFDPVDLGVDVTPATIEKTLKEFEYGRALLMALRLNELEWITLVLDAIPPRQISIIMRGVPSNRLERLLSVLCTRLETSPAFEFYLSLIYQLLLTHAASIKSQLASYGSILRRVIRVCHRARNDCGSVAEQNSFLLDYLCSVHQPISDTASSTSSSSIQAIKKEEEEEHLAMEENETMQFEEHIATKEEEAEFEQEAVEEKDALHEIFSRKKAKRKARAAATQVEELIDEINSGQAESKQQDASHADDDPMQGVGEDLVEIEQRPEEEEAVADVNEVKTKKSKKARAKKTKEIDPSPPKQQSEQTASKRLKR